jgi:hypothetical protein
LLDLGLFIDLLDFVDCEEDALGDLAESLFEDLLRLPLGLFIDLLDFVDFDLNDFIDFDLDDL